LPKVHSIVVLIAFSVLLALPSIVLLPANASKDSVAPAVGSLASANVSPLATQKCPDCWAGWGVQKAGLVTAIYANVKVPALTCTATDTESLFGVALDGFSLNDFAYAAVLAFCSSGSPQYGIQIVNLATGLNVLAKWAPSSGDKVSLRVVESAGIFKITAKDVTSTKTFSKSAAASGAKLNAGECITDMFGATPLTNFGEVNFSGCDATVNGVKKAIGSFGTAAKLVKYVCYDSTSTTLLAQPSVLSTTNHANFHVTWKASGP